MKHLTVSSLLVLCLIACVPTVRVVRYTNEVYSPTTNVEVLRIKPPDRQYIELGELEIKSTRDDAVQYLVQRAKEIGADAIILMPEKSIGAVAAPIGQMIYAAPIRRRWAVAIKYR
jgi:hypothetical protein